MKANKYLCVVDHYVLIDKWVEYTKQISARKTETEEKLEKVWQHAQDFCFYEVNTKEELKKLKEKIQKLISQSCSEKSPDAKNINFYLIPLEDKHLIKHIKFNKKNKDYGNVMHYSNVGVWECIK
tara:strand:- start:758 stop:1132 length:375 start_codon:yes stop_codon:yes gene_type:complete